MTDASARSRRHRIGPRSLVRVVFAGLRRAYALVLIAVILWATFLAVRYLVRSLIRPTRAPAQLVELPVRMSPEEVLQRGRGAWAGLAAVEHARTPLSHYHRLEGWFQPDRFNDCTRSGCHQPLPHARRKEVRAFLNMHATVLHCGICHMQSARRPLALTWYGIADGQSRPPPAALQAYGLLTGADRAALATVSDQQALVALLQAAARDADNEPALRALAAHVQAVRAGSPEYLALLEAAVALVPQHFRGEYGAKLALAGPEGAPVLGTPGTADAVQESLAASGRPGAINPEVREALLARVHPQQRAAALRCTDCHRPGEALIDFAAAGYPEARRQALFRPLVFRTVEHIATGESMQWGFGPAVPSATASAPQTQPAPPPSLPAEPPRETSPAGPGK